MGSPGDDGNSGQPRFEQIHTFAHLCRWCRGFRKVGDVLPKRRAHERNVSKSFDETDALGSRHLAIVLR